MESLKRQILIGDNMKKISHKFEMNEHKAEILHSFRITEHFGEPFLAEHKSTVVLQVLKFRKKIYLGVRFWNREEKGEHAVLYSKTMSVSNFKPEKNVPSISRIIGKHTS